MLLVDVSHWRTDLQLYKTLCPPFSPSRCLHLNPHTQVLDCVQLYDPLGVFSYSTLTLKYLIVSTSLTLSVSSASELSNSSARLCPSLRPSRCLQLLNSRTQVLDCVHLSNRLGVFRSSTPTFKCLTASTSVTLSVSLAPQLSHTNSRLCPPL